MVKYQWQNVGEKTVCKLKLAYWYWVFLKYFLSSV